MSFDFDAAVQAPFRVQPGLRRIAPGTSQLTPTVAPQRGRARHLREKLAVLSCFAGQALLARPDFDAAPALEALAAHAAREHPQVIAVDGPTLLAPALGWTLDPSGCPQALDTTWPEVGMCLNTLPAAWRRAGLLSLAFAEDFAIIDGSDTSIPWLAVALPSMWEPEHKVGRSFAEVHGPVADNERIVAAAAHLAALVSAEPRWERFVWTITRHPRLHAHPQRMDPAPWPEDLQGDALAANAWFRSERQTFIPLPAHNQAVFTISVDVQPLAQAVALPGRAARLREALASMSPAVLSYRALSPVRDRLLRWLDART